MSAKLGSSDVISIMFILKDSRMTSLTWPIDSIAKYLLYSTRDSNNDFWKLSEMSEWDEKASRDTSRKSEHNQLLQDFSDTK